MFTDENRFTLRICDTSSNCITLSHTCATWLSSRYCITLAVVSRALVEPKIRKESIRKAKEGKIYVYGSPHAKPFPCGGRLTIATKYQLLRNMFTGTTYLQSYLYLKACTLLLLQQPCPSQKTANLKSQMKKNQNSIAWKWWMCSADQNCLTLQPLLQSSGTFRMYYQKQDLYSSCSGKVLSSSNDLWLLVKLPIVEWISNSGISMWKLSVPSTSWEG